MSFIDDYQRELKRQNQRGRCLHHSSGSQCDGIVSAHSIQKKGQLSLIAEAGHVYRLNADISVLKKNGGIPELKKIGLKNASTFLGFCKFHDNQLFRPIDDFLLEPSKEQIALYAYRCLCREYFVKENAVLFFKKMKSHSELNAQERKFLDICQTGNAIGLKDLKYHKAEFDAALVAHDYDKFNFVCFISSSTCAMQLSGLLYPDWDFNGNCLQNLKFRTTPLDLITFFTAPMKGGWAFAFGWHVSSNRACVSLIESLIRRVEGGEKIEDAILRFSLSCCENHAVRISWWDGLSEKAKIDAMERILLMTHPQMPVPNDYLYSGCEGIADWSYDFVDTTLPKTKWF